MATPTCRLPSSSGAGVHPTRFDRRRPGAAVLVSSTLHSLPFVRSKRSARLREVESLRPVAGLWRGGISRHPVPRYPEGAAGTSGIWTLGRENETRTRDPDRG